MEVNLYLKEDDGFRFLKVPLFVVKDLLRDRLGDKGIKRIDRFASKIDTPDGFSSGSVVVDFKNRSAEFYEVGIRLDYLEPTWDVKDVPLAKQ